MTTTTAQFAVQATYYSIAKTKDAVILMARWMDDETGATCWTEIDRETGTSESAWKALRTRNMHLLPIKSVA